MEDLEKFVRLGKELGYEGTHLQQFVESERKREELKLQVELKKLEQEEKCREEKCVQESRDRKVVDMATLTSTASNTTEDAVSNTAVTSDSIDTGTVTSFDYGIKLQKFLDTTATRVMSKVLQWGTPDKSPHTNYLTYLKELKPPSNANYLNASNHSQRKFNSHQLRKIKGCKEDYDIPMYYSLIKLGCKNVASLNDPVWYTEGAHLEYLLHEINEFRKDLINGNQELSEEEFNDKAKMLQTLLHNTLTAAHKRYDVSITEDEEIMNVKLEINNIFSTGTSISIEEIMEHAGGRILQDVFRANLVHQGDSYKQEDITDITSIFSGKRVQLNVKNIFTNIRMMMSRKDVQEKECDFRNLLTLPNYGSEKPQILVMDGLPGIGKSTLLSLLLTEWVEGCISHFRGLDHYQFVLRVPYPYRDNSITSFSDLLDDLQRQVSNEFRSILPVLIKKYHLLLIVDGLDEGNESSLRLLKSLLDQLEDYAKCTILCTTRPESLQRFLDDIPSTYDVTRVRLLGIHSNLRSQFVQKYITEIARVTENTQISRTTAEISSLENILNINKYYRLPLNLALLSWLFCLKGTGVEQIMTQAGLHFKILQLYPPKLDRSLTNIKLHFNIQKLNPFKVDRSLLETICARYFKPSLISERYDMKPKLYYKDLKVLVCALEFIKAVKEEFSGYSNFQRFKRFFNKKTVSLEKVMNQYPTGYLFLQAMTCLLSELFEVVPKSVINELASLILTKEKNSEEYLETVKHINPDPTIIQIIAKRLKGTPCMIDDNNWRSWIILLPHLPDTRVSVDIKESDPSCLMEHLVRHTCKTLTMKFQFQHPQPTSELMRHFMKQIMSKSRFILKSYTGHLCPGLKGSAISTLNVAVCSDEQARLLPQLDKLRNLQWLRLHVTQDVSYDTLKKLPEKKYLILDLFLSDVTQTADSLEWAAHVAHNFIPRDDSRQIPYTKLKFPGTTLDCASWEKLLKMLTDCGVKANNITRPSGKTLTWDEHTHLNTYAKANLGGDFTVFNFTNQPWFDID